MSIAIINIFITRNLHLLVITTFYIDNKICLRYIYQYNMLQFDRGVGMCLLPNIKILIIFLPQYFTGSPPMPFTFCPH